jgi:hypothetical protein
MRRLDVERRKRKAAKQDKRQLEELTAKVVTLFQDENGSHDWTPEIFNGADCVRCTQCDQRVTAEAMMENRVVLLECGKVVEKPFTVFSSKQAPCP